RAGPGHGARAPRARRGGAAGLRRLPREVAGLAPGGAGQPPSRPARWRRMTPAWAGLASLALAQSAEAPQDPVAPVAATEDPPAADAPRQRRLPELGGVRFQRTAQAPSSRFPGVFDGPPAFHWMTELPG